MGSGALCYQCGGSGLVPGSHGESVGCNGCAATGIHGAKPKYQCISCWGNWYYTGTPGNQIVCPLCNAVNTVPGPPTLCSKCGGTGLTPNESGPDHVCYHCIGSGLEPGLAVYNPPGATTKLHHVKEILTKHYGYDGSDETISEKAQEIVDAYDKLDETKKSPEHIIDMIGKLADQMHQEKLKKQQEASAQKIKEAMQGFMKPLSIASIPSGDFLTKKMLQEGFGKLADEVEKPTPPILVNKKTYNAITKSFQEGLQVKCSACLGTGVIESTSGNVATCHFCHGHKVEKFKDPNPVMKTHKFEPGALKDVDKKKSLPGPEYKIVGSKISVNPHKKDEVVLGIDVAKSGVEKAALLQSQTPLYDESGKEVGVTKITQKGKYVQAEVTLKSSGKKSPIAFEVDGKIYQSHTEALAAANPGVQVKVIKNPNQETFKASGNLSTLKSDPIKFFDGVEDAAEFKFKPEGEMFLKAEQPMQIMSQAQSGDIIFMTNNCERMRITASGEILVGQSHTHINNVTAKEFAGQFWEAISNYNPLKKPLAQVTAEKDALLKTYIEIKKEAFDTIEKLREDFNANKGLIDRIKDRFDAVTRIMDMSDTPKSDA